MHDDTRRAGQKPDSTLRGLRATSVMQTRLPRVGRPGQPDGALFRTSGWASCFRRPPAGLRPRARRRKREEPNKQKRGHSACLSSLGPSRSSAYPLHRVFPEISFPGTEHRRAKHWSRSLGTASKISIMRRTGSRSAVWRLCVHRKTRA